MIFSIKAHTFASYISPDTNQSLQNSMLSTTLIKNKKSSPLKKNKTFPALNLTDKNGMTELIDNNKGKSLEKKEGQLVTANKLKQGLRASLDRKVLNLKFSSSWQVQWLNSLPAPICRTLCATLKE